MHIFSIVVSVSQLLVYFIRLFKTCRQSFNVASNQVKFPSLLSHDGLDIFLGECGHVCVWEVVLVS